MVTLERITSEAALSELIAASSTEPVVLFKHSTRCPVSTSAHDEVVAFVGDLSPGSARVGVVYVVEERPLSSAIAEKFGVRHESPQILVLRDGEVRWHGSHEAIVHATLAEAVAAVAWA